MQTGDHPFLPSPTFEEPHEHRWGLWLLGAVLMIVFLAFGAWGLVSFAVTHLDPSALP